MVVLLLIVTPVAGFCNCSMFCCALLCVHSGFAIILMGKRESFCFALSSWCLVIVMWLFLTVLGVRLHFVIMVFPDHCHYFCRSPSDHFHQIILNSVMVSDEKLFIVFMSFNKPPPSGHGFDGSNLAIFVLTLPANCF